MARRSDKSQRRTDTAGVPLVRLGQGDYQRDIHPEDLLRPRKTRPGADATLDLSFLIREPADVYHAKANRNLSSHALADFRRCPLLYHNKKLGLIRDGDGAALLLGRATHTLVLEGRCRYEADFAVGGPINPKTGQPYGDRTKAFAEWADRIGKPVLSDGFAALVEMMAASVKSHLFAQELLADGVAEGVMRCAYHGHPCQVRCDWINPIRGRGLVDLKTCENIDRFEQDFERFGYAHQLAFYRAVIQRVAGVQLPVHVIAVESHKEEFWLQGWHRCGVWAIDGALLDRAQAENEAAMDELARCNDTGIWPTRFESILRIPPP